MKRKVTPLTNLGTVSLIMILIVLFLVTFSTLSLTDSLRDNHLSERVADNNYQYYQAVNKASLMLHDIDQVFLSLEDYDGDDYNEKLALKLDALENLTVSHESSRSEQLLLSFSEDVGEKQLLNIELITSNRGDYKNGFYTIEKWVTTSTQIWVGDDIYHLM